LQSIHNLKGERNAQLILRRLEKEEGLINSFRNEEGEKVFYLTKVGRSVVRCEKVRRKTPLVTHFLMRNQFYIYVGCPMAWDNEISINNKVVCDATFEKDNQLYFVEIDNLQSSKNNTSKIKRYVKIREESTQKFVLIWVTSTHARKIRLERQLNGVDSTVYLYTDLI
jgi:AAA+ ATPase superfamily predicted ATPase